MVDLPRVAELAPPARLLTLIDATFATPINNARSRCGMDLVIHSATKYLGGHNDLLAGVVIGSRRARRRAQGGEQHIVGAIATRTRSYLLLRGLKTLACACARQNENGQRVAEFLEGHPGGAARVVPRPGLATPTTRWRGG